MRNYKKYLASFLIVLSSFSSTYSAFAATSSMGGWSMGGAVAQGASAAYNATKNALINGKNVAKTSAAVITPAAADVAKVLGKGVAGVALSVAVEQLLGAVDWVLDPANNQITYTETCEESASCPTVQYIYTAQNGKDETRSSTARQACDDEVAYLNRVLSRTDYKVSSYSDTYCHFTYQNGDTQKQGSSVISKVVNPNYDQNAEEEKKTLPLSTVAEQVISNAESGDTTAQQATMTAASQTIEEAKTDSAKAAPLVTQLEAAAVTPTSETATGTATQTETKTDPVTGETAIQEKLTDLKLTIPKACEWAPSFCEAAAVVIAFPITLTEWWNTSKTKSETWANAISQAWADTKEWATSENKDENTELDFDQQEEATDTTISFDHSCPAPIAVPISWNGHSVDFSFSFDMFCTAMSTYVKPIVIAMGAFHAVLIVSGVRLSG